MTVKGPGVCVGQEEASKQLFARYKIKEEHQQKFTEVDIKTPHDIRIAGASIETCKKYFCMSFTSTYLSFRLQYYRTGRFAFSYAFAFPLCP